MRAGVARDEVAERVGHRLEEGVRDADGQRDAEGVAEAPGILDRRDPAFAREGDPDGSTVVDERGEVGGCLGDVGVWPLSPRRPGSRRRRRAEKARRDLCRVERSEHAQQVGDTFHALHPTLGIETLHLRLELRDDVGVEQLAHLHAPEQLAQQRRVDGESSRAALREGESPSYMNAPTYPNSRSRAKGDGWLVWVSTRRMRRSAIPRVRRSRAGRS